MTMELCWISIPTEDSQLVITHKPAGEKALVHLQREQIQTMNTKMSSRHHLIVQMELVQSLSKLTPEERKVEVRRQMYVELKEVEMERRQNAALETLANGERDREETPKFPKSLKSANMEKDRRRPKAPESRRQNQLKQERLQWQQVMLEGVITPNHNCIALNEEQERRREEADSLTPHLKSPETRNKTLYNNWVAEEEMDSEPVVDNSTYLLYAEKLKPESDGKAAEVKESVQSMQKDILSVGHWVGKYRQNHEKKREKAGSIHRLNTNNTHGPKNTVLNDLLDWSEKQLRSKRACSPCRRTYSQLETGLEKYQQNHEKKRENCCFL
ncbi:hypothetical protein F7725_015448, partial [Dissostichus mawsoni]